MTNLIVTICAVVLLVIYVVVTIITSIHMYARLTDCSEILKNLKPEVYYNSLFAEEWETPMWHRIKVAIKASSIPLFHLRTMSVVVGNPTTFMEVFVNSCRPKKAVEE